MSEDILSIINRLKCSIENSKLSYVELEKRTGIAKSSIQRYASGSTKKIPVDAVIKIAQATDVDLSWIMGLDSGKKAISYKSPLSNNQKSIITSCSNLSSSDLKKVIEYIDFLKTKHTP